MKKGFTLIELLAVIVILAVIALIASPIIMGIIENTNKEAFKSSAYGIIDAAEYYYANEFLIEAQTSEKVFNFPEDNDLNFKGEKPKSGTLIINETGQVALAIHNGKYCVKKHYNDTKLKVTTKPEESCNFEPYKEIILNGADPVLDEGMIPVLITNDGIVTKADTDEDWYNYEQQYWAMPYW